MSTPRHADPRGGDDRDENDHLRGSPDEHSIAVSRSMSCRGPARGNRSHMRTSARARDADEHRPSVHPCCATAAERARRCHDALADRSARTTVALGDVTRVPRRDPILSLGDHRDRKLHERRTLPRIWWPRLRTERR